MSISAANPAGLPHVSLSTVERANERAFRECNGGGELHPSCDGHASSNRAVIAVAFRSQCADENFALKRVCRFVSRLCSGTASGLFMRPAAARSSASAAPPCGLRFPSKSCSERTPKRFLRSLRKCRASALGSMAHSLDSVPRSRSGNSTNGDNHVPEQSNPHRLPRQQRRSRDQQPRTSASPLFRWQPSPPTRRMASTSRTPNGTVASSSASSRSSPRRSPRAHISRWKANCAAGSTTARKRTRSGASGKFGSLRS